VRLPILPALSGLQPNVLRAGVEILLVALLGIQAARLVWVVATPPGPLGVPSITPSVSASDLVALSRSNPFAGKASPTEDHSGGALRLVGVRADGEGGGAAFFSVEDGRHRVYAVGEEIAPGTKLKAVAGDHVVLLRAGGEVRVSLTPVAAAGAPVIPPYMIAAALRPSQPSSPATPSVVPTDPAKLLDQVGLRPRLVDGRVSGYTLLPRGDGALMRAAGLQPGDVLVALNGNHLTPERYSELSQELEADEVQLTIQRGAEMRTITLKTGK
jgi:general secretion pathway protein C